MEKVFWSDPYQHTLHTTITNVSGNEILLKASIAYSFSGGQESDHGTVNDLNILNSRMDGNLIFYALPEEHGLKPNQSVLMKINWPRRYRLMRLHFAAELILELVTQKFHLEKVGAHIAESKARIDFNCDQNISELFEDILPPYVDIIDKNLIIQTGFSDIIHQRRFWKIDGFAEVPCGGTHVKSTGEVGLVTLKRARPGKGVERIEIRLCDDVQK